MNAARLKVVFLVPDGITHTSLPAYGDKAATMRARTRHEPCSTAPFV